MWVSLHNFFLLFWRHILESPVAQRANYLCGWWHMQAVGTWIIRLGHGPHRLPESTRRAPMLMQYGEQFLLLSIVGLCTNSMSWGPVSWLQHFPRSHLAFEGEVDCLVFYADSWYLLWSHTRDAPAYSSGFSRRSRVRDFLSLLVLLLAHMEWCIWKARFSHILNREPLLPMETVHTLRSIWGAWAGTSRAAENKYFHCVWARGACFYILQMGGWQSFLFLHPTVGFIIISYFCLPD